MLNWQGEVNIKALDKDGNVLQEDKLKNLITSAGKNLLAESLRNASLDAEIKFISIGSDNTAPSSGDTTLGTRHLEKQLKLLVVQSELL